MKGKGFKLKESKFRSDIGKFLKPEILHCILNYAVKGWRGKTSNWKRTNLDQILGKNSSLRGWWGPGEVVGGPPLECSRLGWTGLRATRCCGRGLDLDNPQYPSQPTHPMAVWAPSSCRGPAGRGARADSHLVVEGTDVQGGVPRGVLRAHVGPVEQQVLQVLHVPVPAGLARDASRVWLLHSPGKSSRERFSAEKVLFLLMV